MSDLEGCGRVIYQMPPLIPHPVTSAQQSHFSHTPGYQTPFAPPGRSSRKSPLASGPAVSAVTPDLYGLACTELLPGVGATPIQSGTPGEGNEPATAAEAAPRFLSDLDLGEASPEGNGGGLGAA